VEFEEHVAEGSAPTKRKSDEGWSKDICREEVASSSTKGIIIMGITEENGCINELLLF
jgi:hypothetical protein